MVAEHQHDESQWWGTYFNLVARPSPVLASLKWTGGQLWSGPQPIASRWVLKQSDWLPSHMVRQHCSRNWLGIESMTTYPDKISVTTWSGAFSQSVPRYESSNRRMDRHIATCADAQQPREINFKFV